MPESPPPIIPLWDGTPPNHLDSDLVEQSFPGEMLRIIDIQTPTIEVRLPAGGNATGEAVVVCPGGGYEKVMYDWEGTDIASWLNSNGIAAIVLKYRQPDKRSSLEPCLTPLLDAKRAIRIARHRAADWGYSPDKVGVMGFSAGGHVASMLGTCFDSGDASNPDPIEQIGCRPNFMVLVYPVITMQGEFAHEGSRLNLIGENPSSELEERYSSELQVTSETPPTFLLHSSDDGAVPVQNSQLFYDALLAQKVDAEMHLYPYGGHGYSLAVGQGRLQGWTTRCIEWINGLVL